MKQFRGLWGTLLLSVLLAACGGGSGSGHESASTASSSASSASSETSSAASSASSSSGGTTAVTIHMLGDSTMTTYTDSDRPQYGWGEKFGQFFNSNVTIKNWAAGGRSSRSFYYESGKWDSAKAAIQSGDYVIIQFGHNDQKYGDTSSTGPYSTYGTYAICSDATITDGENCTGGTDVVDTTTTLDEHSYYQFLKRYVTEIRALGGIPILMTPVVRRYMSSGSVTAQGQHDFSAITKGTETNPRGNYPAAMKAVATNYSVPIIDLTAGTKTLVETYGASAAITPYLYYPDDTHLNGLYASLVAKMAIEGLKSNSILTDYIVSVPSVVSGSSSVAFSDTYSGSTATAFFNLAGYDLLPTSGSVTLTAPTGFTLSTDQTTWSSSLSVSYSSGAFTQTVYVKFAPTDAQSYTGSITAVLSSTTMASISVSGTGLAAVQGTDSYGLWPMMNGSLTGSATGLVTVSDAVVSTALASLGTTTTSGLIGSTTYTVNRYSATQIAAADSTRYIEFQVTPSGAYTITSITSYFGGSGGSGVYVDAVYSTDGFATSTTLDTKFNPGSTSSTAGYLMTSWAKTGLAIPVASGQTFALRLYPYYKDTTSTSKFLSIANMTIDGSVQ